MDSNPQLYILNFQLTLHKGILISISFRLIPVVYHIPVNKEPCCIAMHHLEG